LRTDETNNKEADDEGYSNISVIQPIQQFLMTTVRAVQERMRPSHTDEGDAFSALAIAVQMMSEHCRHLKYRKNIILVTDGRGSINADDEDISNITKKITQDGINLTVLGVDFDDSDFGVKEEDKPEHKADNESILKQITDGCNGSFGTMAEAISFLGIPRVKTIRPTPLYKGTLTLGDTEKYDTALCIRVTRYSRVKIAKPPTASSYVVRQDMAPSESEAEAAAAAAARNGEDVEMAVRDGLVSVKNARTYQVDDENAPGGKKDVDFDSLAKGYEYGRTTVHISESDWNVTELDTMQGLEIVGFVPKEKVSPHQVAFVLKLMSLV
jgi:ATP-dependent DNA helicase 2 subunit 2